MKKHRNTSIQMREDGVRCSCIMNNANFEKSYK